MKNFSLLLLATIILSACSKEIKVVKNPPGGNGGTPSNQYAVFTSNSELSGGISLEENRKYYSLSTAGLEQEILMEDGSPALSEGHYIDGMIQTKTELIIGVGHMQDGPTQYKIYRLVDGKTLKLISEDNRIRAYYPDLYEGYKIVNQNITYFCASQGVMMWDDEKKQLSNLQALTEGEYCTGRQIKDQFYFFLNSESDEGKTISVSRVRNSGTPIVEEIDSIELSENENIWVSGFAEIGNKVALLIHYDYYDSEDSDNNTSAVQLVLVDKDSLEGDIVYEKIEEGNYVYGSILNNGNLFNGKLLLEVASQREIEPTEIYTDDEENLVATVLAVEDKEFFSVSEDDMDSLLSIEGEPMANFYLLRSEDTLFILKNQTRFYMPEGADYPYSYSIAQLLNLELELIRDLHNDPNYNTQIHWIKGKNIISVSAPQDDDTQKISVFLLPNASQGLVEDTRFADRSLRFIYFANFYDKVIFQGQLAESTEYDPVIGFFGDDGIITMINKIKAALINFFT